jgi:DNA-binding SARP family transcriptional activator
VSVASSLLRRSASILLLDGFELRLGDRRVDVPFGTQRVLAYLALSERPVLRIHLAGALWLESSEEHAFANLRSTLWRLKRVDPALVEASGQSVRLSDDVDVDLHRASELARRVLGGAATELLDVDPEPLRKDLLPDWYEDWALIERERYRQLRLSALDALCERLTRAGRLALAMETGLASLAAEPLRESAHRALIRIHLAEGNKAEALRQYRFYRDLLRDHLRLEPSQQMEALVRELDVAETIG